MRQVMDESQRDWALHAVKEWLEGRIKQKGDLSFSSLHELRGVLHEEFEEVMEAMHQKDLPQVQLELLDLAAAAVFGLACLRYEAIKNFRARL